MRIRTPTKAADRARKACSIRVLGVLLSGLLTLWGCATEPYKTIDPGVLSDEPDIGLVYITPRDEIYVEISRQGRRYADFELSVGTELLASVAGSALGAYAGYTYAAATAPYGAAVAIDPVTAGLLLVTPLVGAGVEASKQRTARARAEPFLELVKDALPSEAFFKTLSASINGEDSFLPASIPTLIIGQEEKMSTREILDAIGTSRVIIVSTMAAFTPRFEAIEVSALYGVLDATTKRPERLYENAVVVQSTHRVHLNRVPKPDDFYTFFHQDRDAKIQALNKVPRMRTAYYRKKAVAEINRDAKKRLLGVQESYTAYDTRDRDGDDWRANNGIHFETQLQHVYAEAARLIYEDLRGATETSDAAKITPLGYSREMFQHADLSNDSNTVYRLESGQLISAPKNGWVIPLSDENR